MFDEYTFKMQCNTVSYFWAYIFHNDVIGPYFHPPPRKGQKEINDILVTNFVLCSSNACFKCRRPFHRVDVNKAKYFWQWNARTDQVTISYELLSVDNFASFYLIHSNICSKSSLYVSFPHKTRSDEFRTNTKARTAKNPIFVIQSISLLPSCSAILDFTCRPYMR